MRKLLCLVTFVVMLFAALPVVAQGVAVQVCTNQDTTVTGGTCYRVRALSSLSAGMGGAAGLQLAGTAALLYAHGAAGTPLVLNLGPGTSAGALRVVTASDSPGGSAVTPSHVNVQQVGGNTVTAGAGAVAAGTQRVTLASDDPGVTELQKNPWATADDDETTVCTALTAANQQYTVPQTGDWYIIKVIGNTAYILGGADPTATTAANGHVYPISSGEKLVIPINSAKIAFIALTATGEICFMRLNSSL